MFVDSRKLRTLLTEPDALLSYLHGMSNSQFRDASRMLGESLLVDMPDEDFWPLFRCLFFSNRKAYLGTLLKALVLRIKKQGRGVGSLDMEQVGLWNRDFELVCMELTETDCKKVLMAMLPMIERPEDAERLFVQCGQSEALPRIPYLLQIQTLPCAYLLLKALRYVEHDRALLIRTCHFLMRRGDECSFNVASLIRISFGLDEVHGTFSLFLEPYQLARVEQNYEAFCQALAFS